MKVYCTPPSVARFPLKMCSLALLTVIARLLLSAGDVERNPGPLVTVRRDDTPTILNLKEMKRADGMNVIEIIAACDYKTFGMYLLKDDNGLAVDLLKKNHIHDGAESVTEEIFKKWLTSSDATRTYQHLIECLRKSKLGASAELIEKRTEEISKPIEEAAVLSQKKSTATMKYSREQLECVLVFKQGNKQAAERLLPQIQRPADIRTTTEDIPWYAEQVSLLHLAAWHSWMDIVIKLITKYKCDTNGKDSVEQTPLHYVTIKGRLEMIKYFINEQNCDPSCGNKNGDAPLHFACRYGHLSIVQYLIFEAHCNPSCGNNNGKAPLHFACHYGHCDIARYLICKEHCDPSCGNSDGEAPLHFACRYGHLDIAKYLICEISCDPSCGNKDGEAPLHFACRYGHLDIARYLICEERCDPSCGNKDGAAPLHFACHYGHLDIAQYLIREAHCDPSCGNNDGETSLHFACRFGHTNIVKYLLHTGLVNPQSKSKNGSTPVDFASTHHNSYDLLKLFQPFISEDQ